MNLIQIIATELNVNPTQITAAVKLLDEGATVPFIARYRKEVTGGLSDTHLRILEERLSYLRELQDRKNTILNSIREQQKLTPELEQLILETSNKSQLEDLYLPYKPKRRTKAQLAREAGLEPLAEWLYSDIDADPQKIAGEFIQKNNLPLTVIEALDGAKHILIEKFAEHAPLLSELRSYLQEHAIVKSTVVSGKEDAAAKFHDYFNYEEPLRKIPSHRALAIFRGQREEFLSIELIHSEADVTHCIHEIQHHFPITTKNTSLITFLSDLMRQTWRQKLSLKFELELLTTLKEHAEESAIQVFAENLKHLLMAAPAGTRTTMGVDPGLRTGVKLAIVDQTGKLMHYDVIYPHAPKNDWEHSIHHLAHLSKKYHVELISIGNGTASRETDQLIQQLKKQHPELNLTSLVVSEAGASVYSASDFAAKEFPDLDVSYRGAVSIARRLQDPLAELVKIDPKSIGVGQYQHDVNQVRLSKTLHTIMQDCVNAVGVDLNTASEPLLSCIAGLNHTIANNIIEFRNQHGSFASRMQLKKVPRLGEKAFEQCAGFLRIQNGTEPLDASSVHPESYEIAQKIMNDAKVSIKQLIGNHELLKKIRPQHYITERFGLPTVTDILKELEKPARDPRPEFKTARFQDDVHDLSDLKIDQQLEGVITNVTHFGAFVDIGVHQDGLVHISELSHQFVRDAAQVVKVGQVVRVRVLNVDAKRKRIQLSMKLGGNKNI